MTQIKITACRGRLIHQYSGQINPQRRYIEIDRNGGLHIDWNAEVGNAVPADVYHGIRLRITGEWRSKKSARDFIARHKENFQRVIDGMGERWNGSNHVGTLTDDARDALDQLGLAVETCGE